MRRCKCADGDSRGVIWLVGRHQFLSSPLAGKRDIVVTIFVRCMCMRPCISASVRICPDHNLYSNAWISKQFGTVLALEEEKCHLKLCFR